MSVSADLDRARLSVLLDVRYPTAFLALPAAIDFGESLGIDINWLPLDVPALKPPRPPRDTDDRGIRHRRHRALAIARELETYAGAQGLVLRDPYRSGDTNAANLGWLWLRDRHPQRLTAYLGELFRAYWSLGLDPSSGEQIAALVNSLTADGPSFGDWSMREGEGVLAALRDELRNLGLLRVPAYVVEDEVFYGRQHLPMIRWILEGRSGPVPI